MKTDTTATFDVKLKPKNRNLIISALNTTTNLPYNRLENEIGTILDFCLKHNYNNRCTMAACFGVLWKRYSKIYESAEKES